MSDIDNHLKWLRGLARASEASGTDDPVDHIAWATADLLEEQANRIAELEELLTEPLYASEHYVLNKTYKKHANDKIGRITVSFGWMRRLHAALNGEKG